jgi:hypothetical protein
MSVGSGKTADDRPPEIEMETRAKRVGKRNIGGEYRTVGEGFVGCDGYRCQRTIEFKILVRTIVTLYLMHQWLNT